MKFEARFRPGDDVRALWLVALGVLLTGSYYVQTRYQDAIADSHRRSETLYRETVADARIIREASSLHAIQQRAEADLARVKHDTSLSATTAHLLITLHASAKRFDAQVLQIQPGTPGGTQASTGGALEATALTIRVRATFRDVLRFVEDLSHHATLVKISDTEIALAPDAQQDASEPQLDATIHATMYRVSMPDDKELRVASAR